MLKFGVALTKDQSHDGVTTFYGRSLFWANVAKYYNTGFV